ncbi:MAG: superoxide reductase [Planctomycetes bacterium]|nr:superoxide reductase [Planctomycetota bacterium]
MAEVVNLLQQMNKVADPANMTELEMKHNPVISCPDSAKADEPFECTVHVGKLKAHPNEAAHHIEFIDLYVDDLFLCRVDLQARKSNPRITFEIMLRQSGVLKAYQSCNMHGVWVSEKKMSIS